VTTTSNPPLLIIGHGTCHPVGAGQFLALTARVAARAAGDIPGVAGGVIEFSRPTVAEAMDRLLGRPEERPREGSGRPVIALPLLLGTAMHVEEDIPALLARETDRRPGLAVSTARALGPHPVLHDLLRDRIDEALAGQDRAGTHVVLVAQGTTRPEANARIAAVARLLWEGSGYASVEPSFIAVAEPRLPAVLDKVRRLGARRVVVAPYFLFAGALIDRTVEQGEAFAAAHPDIDVRVAEVIGDCDEVADIVLERYRDALPSPPSRRDHALAGDHALLDVGGRHAGAGVPHGESRQVHDHDRGWGEGRVALVGAGPGPEGLITVRGARLLAEADVVVADRLVPAGLLASLPERVRVIDAGKVPHAASAKQEDINATLIEHAHAGRRVVRLKGGDPFVFGRGFEEVIALREAGIEPEVVPGVSSALAAPALAGVPVTHRATVHEFTVVSGHLPPGHPDSLTDWSALARQRGTIVLLMGVGNAGKIAATLIEHGRPGDSPAMVVERAGTPEQRRVITSLDRLEEVVIESGIRPPATIVIGPTAALPKLVENRTC
jgi:sirohydrochlorin cobaltochelatase